MSKMSARSETLNTLVKIDFTTLLTKIIRVHFLFEFWGPRGPSVGPFFGGNRTLLPHTVAIGAPKLSP